MAKLKNFTLEGEHLVLIAHLDFKTGKPVIDIASKKDGFIVTGNDNLLTAVPAQTFSREMVKLSDEIYDLCRSYQTEELIGRFVKEWGGEEDAGTQSGDEGGEDA